MAKRKNKKVTAKRNRLKGNTVTVNRKYKDTEQLSFFFVSL